MADVRAGRPGDRDAVARLLYLSAAGMYDRWAGGPEQARRLLELAYGRPGTNASAEVAWVAEEGGTVTGALAGFPISEAAARGRAFLRLTLGALPPWRWPGVLRLYRLGARVTPPAPPSCFYVDGLATEPALRRRGAARALLAAAEERADALGLPMLALDTAADNAPARMLYESAGLRCIHEIPPGRGLPGLAGYVKRLP